MKACVVTVYNSTNCGSFLQAYALKYTLENLGLSVSFLKTGVKNNRKILIRKILRNLKHGNVKKVVFDYQVFENFERAIKNYATIPYENDKLKEQDLFILGSDEIWNASRDIIRNATVFWGKGLPGRIISYAPSVNTASEDELIKIQGITELFSEIEHISVRDAYSYEVVSKFTDKPVSILCDPTFLLPLSEYEKIEGVCPFENFILVYSAGGRFNSKDKKNIKAFASKTGKMLVAFPHMLDWCDNSAPADPFNAIAYFKKADFVITDTFHGTALSLIFNKDFVSIPRGNTKVSEELKFFGLSHLETNSTDDLEKFFRSEVYSRDDLNMRIVQEREKSVEFLKKIV